MILDYIIVGQGIAGSLLGYELLKAGRKIIVVDEDKPSSSSKIATGIIQPITGRRIVKTWQADLLIPFARNYYNEIENHFGVKLFHDLPLLEIFDSVKTRNDWIAKSSEPGYEKYIGSEIYPEFMKNVFKSPQGGILINNAGYVDIEKLTALLKKYFLENSVYNPETFAFDEMKIKAEGIKWKNITASKIIFCQGYSLFPNPFFSHLPFLPAKGENSIIFSDKLTQDYIISNHMQIVPLGNNLFKTGSTFQWNFKDDKPTENGKRQVELFLNNFLNVNYKFVSHHAAIRPTVQDRRPFIGLHHVHPSIGIFNGLGTKGVLLAPYFAKQLLEFLRGKGKIDKEVDVRRYQ